MQVHAKDHVRIDLDQISRMRIETALRRILTGRQFVSDGAAEELADRSSEAVATGLSYHDILQLRLFARGRGAAFVVITGLPTLQNLPPTPYRSSTNNPALRFVDAQLLALYKLMDLTSIAYDFENEGMLFRDVAPNLSDQGRRTSHGWDLDLALHSDNPCADFEGLERGTFDDEGKRKKPIPHFIGWIGLRNQDRRGKPVPTEVLPLGAVLSRISDSLLGKLYLPRYSMMPPASNSCLPFSDVPVLEGDPKCGGPFIRFNADDGEVIPGDLVAERAISELCDALRRSESDVVPINVGPGVALIIDNYRALHRRRSFEPGDSLAKARWLRRCYACLGSRAPTRIIDHHTVSSERKMV